MSLSPSFLIQFDHLVQQAKETACTQIDMKAQTLRELILKEVLQQRDELLEKIIGNASKAKQGGEVSLNAVDPGTSQQSSSSTVSSNTDSNDTFNHHLNVSLHKPVISQSSRTQSTVSNLKQQLQKKLSLDKSPTTASTQINDKQPVIKEEEVIDLDEEDDDCNCADCQSPGGSDAAAANKGEKGTTSKHHQRLGHGKKRNPHSNQQNEDATDLNSTLNQSTSGSSKRRKAAKIHPCPLCGKFFESMANIRQHLRTHTNNRPYRCKWPDCTSSANSVANINKHIRLVHFHLPDTLQKQREQGIIDERDPAQWVEILEDLL